MNGCDIPTPLGTVHAFPPLLLAAILILTAFLVLIVFLYLTKNKSAGGHDYT